jgi:hypothetical protein
VSSSIVRHSYLELDGAPQSAGIYAWYVDFPMGAMDWQPHVTAGADLGVMAAFTTLRDFATYHRQRPIRLRGAGDYDASWSGALRASQLDQQITRLLAGEELDLSESGNSTAASLAQVLHHPTERELLGDALREITPIFSSPVYIGVASNLRERLATHRGDYEKAHKYLEQNPDHRESLEQSPKFGVRLAAANVPLDYLVVYTLEVTI